MLVLIKNKGKFRIMNHILPMKDYKNLIGADGSGKDTIFELIKRNYPSALLTREPGGTEHAEIIRSVILEKDLSNSERISLLLPLLHTDSLSGRTKNLLQKAQHEIHTNGMTGMAEAFLYAASRSDNIENSIQPALESGIPVLGRRSVACSVAYQGNARGLGMERIWELNHPIVKDTYPTLEIFFDLPTEVAMKRLAGRTEKQDRLDGEDVEFFEKVREGYLYYYKNICPYPYVIVDATKSIEEVHKQVKNLLK